MHFDLKPDNQEISEIIAAQVRGPYRYVNDAMSPYVRLEPVPGESITVSTSDRLRLTQNALSKATTSPMTFVVMFDEVGICLKEIFAPGARVLKTSPRKPPADSRVTEVPRRTVRLGSPVVEMQPEGGVRVDAPTPVHARPHKRMKLVSTPGPSGPTDVSVPDALKGLVAREDVHPEMGDYLVIPAAMASVQETEPPWVVRSPHVAQVHVVKPRLAVDKPITREM